MNKKALKLNVRIISQYVPYAIRSESKYRFCIKYKKNAIIVNIQTEPFGPQPLTNYFVTAVIMNELLFLQIAWITIKMLVYCVSAFWMVGAEWNRMQLLVFFMVALSSFSYGIIEFSLNRVNFTICVNFSTSERQQF